MSKDNLEKVSINLATNKGTKLSFASETFIKELKNNI